MLLYETPSFLYELHGIVLIIILILHRITETQRKRKISLPPRMVCRICHQGSFVGFAPKEVLSDLPPKKFCRICPQGSSVGFAIRQYWISGFAIRDNPISLPQFNDYKKEIIYRQGCFLPLWCSLPPKMFCRICNPTASNIRICNPRHPISSLTTYTS